MSNREKLQQLVIDVFLLDPSEFSFALKREDVDTWDSLGVVSLAVGVHEAFGYHFTQQEALRMASIQDVIDLLETKGVRFDA